MNIDYSTLGQPPTAQDIKNYKATFLAKKNLKVPILIGASVLAGALMTTLCILELQSGRSREGMVGLILAVLMLAAVIGGALYGTMHRRRVLVEYMRFAQANRAKLIVAQDNPAYAGMIFSLGGTRKINEAYIFSDGLEIGNYTYVIGYGKSRREFTWGYLRVKLVRQLPHIVLDSRKNNFLAGLISNLPQSYRGSQTMRLGGDFDTYFTTYVPGGYGRDALYLFTPDVLATLIDHAQEYDIEVVQDELYLYKKDPIRLDDASHINDALTIAQAVGGELIHQGDYYADERVESRENNDIAPSGRRLKRGVGAGTLIILAVLILYVAVRLFGLH